MRRPILLFILSVLLFSLPAAAQRYVVTGSVVNEQSKQPVEFASAALLRPDSTVVGGAMTDERGAFSIAARAAGSYILKLSYVGYTTAFRNVRLTAENDSVHLAALPLASAEKMLGTAVASVTAARVEQKEDTTVFNAAAYRVPEGSTLEGLVKQLPGVEVADDGTIKWNGKEVKEFLVNGKDFFKGDTKIAMKNLPTELVSKIKAYDKQSDYTEQTGIDDGEETTVLDISTKRALNESWVSNVDLALGTKDRYAGRIFATRFTDRSRITAYGAANNTNDRGFGGARGFGGGGGLTANKNAGLDFSWDNGRKQREAGRLELGGNVRYNHSGTDALSRSASETFLSSGAKNSFANSTNFSRSASTSVNAALRLQWNPDTLTSITFRPSYSHSDGHNSGASRSATFNDDPYAITGVADPLDAMFPASGKFEDIDPLLAAIAVNTNQRTSLGSSRSNGVNGSLNVVRRFGSLGRNISLSAQGGYTKSTSRSFTQSTISYYQGAADPTKPSFLNQYSQTPSQNFNYGVRLSYTEPITKNWFAEARYGYNYKYSQSDRSRYNLERLADDDVVKDVPGYEAYGNPLDHPAIGALPTLDEALNAVRDLYNSQYATYKYYNHSLNAGVRYQSEKIRFNAGLGIDPQRTKMQYTRLGQGIDTLITRRVLNVSPNLRFRYRFSKTNQLQVMYRGSASQPSMTDLLAVVDNSNPLSISMGNPGLKPVWNNSLRANYNGYNPERQRGIMGGIDLTLSSKSISNRVVYDEETGVRYSRPENITGNWSGRGHFMFNTALGEEKLFNISTFTNLSYSNSVGYISRRPAASSGRSAAAYAFFAAPLEEEAPAPDGLEEDHDYQYYDNIFARAASQKNTTRTLGLGENLSLTYRAAFFDFSLNGRVNYQHARATQQENANLDTWNYAYGASVNTTLNCGLSLSTDIRMNSRRGYADRAMNTNELLWNAQIAQSFLKNKAATISLQFYDILHEQSNVSRTISALQRSDSWNNAINSYCMVHFIYKLNIFGGKRGSGPQPQGERGTGRGDRQMRGSQSTMRAMPMMAPARGGHGF